MGIALSWADLAYRADTPTNRPTDRQTDRQKDIQSDRQIDRQTERKNHSVMIPEAGSAGRAHRAVKTVPLEDQKARGTNGRLKKKNNR